MHLEQRVDHRHAILAHAAGADRMEIVHCRPAQIVVDLRRGADVRAGIELALAIAIVRRLEGDLAPDPDGRPHPLPVLIGRKEVGEDARRILRIGRAKLHPAAALHAIWADAVGEAVTLGVDAVGMIEDHGEVLDLDVRLRLGRIAPEKRHGLQVVAGRRPAMQHEPLHRGDRHPVGTQVAGDGERLGTFVLHVDARMVLQVRPDAGKIDRNLDAMTAQLVRGADSGQHEQLRRVERAARQDDLAGRLYLPLARRDAGS